MNLLLRPASWFSSAIKPIQVERRSNVDDDDLIPLTIAFARRAPRRWEVIHR